MLFQIGPRRDTGDVVDLFLECHARIRRFSALAVRLPEGTDRPATEIAETAGAIRRYFADALPLHVADEEEQVAPRLAGRSDAVDRALATMATEHGDHQASLARLIALCTLVEREPAGLAEVATELATLAAELAARFEEHLALEEAVIFPALRSLPPDDLEAIRLALHARRSAPR